MFNIHDHKDKIIYLLFNACLLGITILLYFIMKVSSIACIVDAGVALATLPICYTDIFMIWAIKARKINKADAPVLYKTIDELCIQLDVPVPDIYIVPCRTIDVFSASNGRNNGSIIITSRVLDSIDKQSIRDILMIELAKIRNNTRSFIRVLAYIRNWLNNVATSCLLRRSGAMVIDSTIRDEFNVREASEDDLPDMFRLERFEFREDALSIHDLKKIAMGKSSVSIVIEKNGKLIGYIIGGIKLSLTGAYGRIDLLIIDGNYRKEGFGRYLVMRMLEILSAASCNYVILEVAIDNIKAIRLYESLGFKSIGIRKNYYSKGIHAILMKKELTASITVIDA